MRRWIVAALALLLAAPAAAQSNREQFRYWFVWPDVQQTTWSRLERWVPVESDSLRCVIQNERADRTWDGIIYLHGTAPPPRVDTVVVVRVDTVFVPVPLPPDTTPIPPDTVPTPPDTTSPPPSVRRLTIAAQPRSPGAADYSVDATVLDTTGTPQIGVTVTMRVTGGAFGPGTTLETRTTGGTCQCVRINWAGMAVGDSLVATSAGVAPASFVHGAAVPPPTQPPIPPLPGPTDSTNVTPPALMAVLGPMVKTTGSPMDNRFVQYEQRAYDDALAAFQANAPNTANHYDGFIGRLARDLRDGRTTYSAHGRDIVTRYLAWSKSTNYTPPPHNNTGLWGIETLYRLDGNPDALMHIWCTAGFQSGLDPFGYLQGLSVGSDPRQPAVALQAQSAAHRLGIAYTRCPANVNTGPDASLGSWLNATRRQIDWIDRNYVEATGRMVSNAHHDQCGSPECECYFMSAMLATELLRSYAYVEANPKALELAGRIMGHLVDTWQALGGPLGYLNNRGPGTANDLASFYVWPALVIWQESGEARFRDFALAHIQAASIAPNQQLTKQWNQVNSPMVQGADALLAGVPWH